MWMWIKRMNVMVANDVTLMILRQFIGQVSSRYSVFSAKMLNFMFRKTFNGEALPLRCQGIKGCIIAAVFMKIHICQNSTHSKLFW